MKNFLNTCISGIILTYYVLLSLIVMIVLLKVLPYIFLIGGCAIIILIFYIKNIIKKFLN